MRIRINNESTAHIVADLYFFDLWNSVDMLNSNKDVSMKKVVALSITSP